MATEATETAETSGVGAKDLDVQQTRTEIENRYEVEVVEIHHLHAVSIRKVVPVAEIGNFFKTTVEFIIKWASETHNLPKPETTYGRYYKYDGKEFDVEVGMIVPKGIKGSAEIKTSSLPSGKAAMIWHYGPMDNVAKAYDALDKWMRKEGRLPAGAPFEYHYLEHFEKEDPEKFKTQIFFPIMTFIPPVIVKFFRR